MPVWHVPGFSGTSVKTVLLHREIVAESQAFNDYGQCVLDAIRNGFKPSKDPYETVMKDGRTAFYKKGRAPKIQQ